MVVKRESGWTYETSSSVSGGYGFVSVGFGNLYLVRPDKSKMQFRYESAGVGAGVGVKVPKLPKEVTAGFGPKEYPSKGRIYVLDGLDGHELDDDDFIGFCTIQEAIIFKPALPATARSYTAMIMGIEPDDLYRELAGEAITFSAFGLILDLLNDGFNWHAFIRSYAKALLLMESYGNSSTTFGATGSLGFVADAKTPLPFDQVGRSYVGIGRGRK